MSASAPQYEQITTPRRLAEFCQSLANEPAIAFDTEFVSEDSYRPDLCLLQVAAGERLAIIDAHAARDLTPFWELLADPQRETIVHAGREEFRFYRLAMERRPARLVDIQVAAGLVGMEYPAAYSTLVSRVLGKTLAKGETRTNWRQRPLSQRQLDYAIQDVLYLAPLRRRLGERLEELGRTDWLAGEMEDWQTDIEAADSDERWRRLPSLGAMSPRSLAIARGLWTWREDEAEQRNLPARRILRDDLIVELARRETADPKRIRAVRGLERRDLERHLTAISRTIEEALALPAEECPDLGPRNHTPQVTLLSQFLAAALGSICRSAEVAPSLVGTVDDLRRLIAYRLGTRGSSAAEPPSLATGWRADIVGQRIEDLLAGKLAIRILDPLSDHPLQFAECADDGSIRPLPEEELRRPRRRGRRRRGRRQPEPSEANGPGE